MPKLIITTEAQGEISHDFTEDLITIGRAPDNMIIIEDPSVSGHHAELRIVGGKHRLKDIGSTNGTRVNGNAITEMQLGHGDRVRFGGVDGRYEAIDPTAMQPLPQEIEAKPAKASAVPADFGNASPFPRRRKETDPARTGLLAVAAIALLAFLGSMIAVLAIHAPVL